MEKSEKVAKINNIIDSNFVLTDEEKNIVSTVLNYDLNFDRLYTIILGIVEYKLDKNSLLAFLNYQLFKSYPDEADSMLEKLNDETKEMVKDYKTIRDINKLTTSEEIDDIKRLFIVMSNDMRVVIIKLLGIYYDLSMLQNPLDEEDKRFLKQVKEIHIPLSERMGLDKLKQNLYDYVVKIEYPVEYNNLKNTIESKKEENEKQLEISKSKIQTILTELKIDGKIESRIKHISSIFNKLHNKQLNLDQIYDILAMRVIVNTVEECYAVLGRVHAVYKPMIGRVKDYIANPKPNGYKSLHTTIIVENQHPMEIQIRTFEMHKDSEYGIYAHWLYKEKKDKKSDFDNRLTWFRQTIENAKNMSNSEFIETLKSDLYDGIIIAQTPKGRVLEFPTGATVVDFAYAIHSAIGNTCVGARINGKMTPITTKLCNGDIVEIITNNNSKGPSRDWLKFVKTASARSKIKAFFKNELKDENIKLGKSMFNQAVQDKGLITTQILTPEYLEQILKRFNMESIDEVYAAIGSESITANQVVSRFQALYNNDNKQIQKIDSVVRVKRNKDGILIDGDSGMLIRFAGCCNPIEGDDIIGYISRGKGVTIHRSNCPNLKYLEKERLINANWQVKEDATFTASIKIVASKLDNNIGKLTNSITGLKINIKGFDVKDIDDSLLCTLIIEVKNKNDLNNAINSIKNLKSVISVYRSER